MNTINYKHIMSPLTYPPEARDRIAKLDRIRSFWVNPFATRFDTTHQIQNILAKHPQKIDTETDENPFRSVEEIIPQPTDDIAIAGRVVLHRSFGKICFATIFDGTAKIQVLFSRENCSISVGKTTTKELKNADESDTITAYKFAEKLIDLADFVGVKWELFYTHKWELTLFVKSFSLLTKAIRPLPEKWHGIENDDERYRKRYLDIATDDAVREMLLRKAKFWQVTRNFLEEKWFLEVETPILEHTTGGAEARPFCTHHNDHDIEVYLRISVGELWQKRLMAGGYPKTFEIGRVFRNEGSSPEHLQEFSNMEFYWAYADYQDGMKLVQEMYRTIAKEVYGTTQFSAKWHTFDLADEWEQIDYLDIVREKTGIDLLVSSDDEIKAKLAELKVEYDGDNRERLTDTLWKYVRKQISGPAFLIHHPQIISPLAKESATAQWKVERFQPIIAGSEVGNGYSELNDPIDQKERFEKQQELLASGDDEAMMPDWDFVEMLEHGMPPTCGFGFGERLFAFFEGKTLRECQYFPFVKSLHQSKKEEEK